MQAAKPLILCVDDDSDILDSLQTLLRANGYECAAASTAEAALRMFEQTRPDAVIMDLMMEEIDAGTSLVKELRAKGCKAPLFMLSSVGDSLSVSTDYQALGLSGVLQKPVARETLLSLLREKLRK